METKKLFYDDVTLREFDATVLRCEEGKAGFFLVVLDRTAFYPEGGGQPADIGTLVDAPVTEVHEKAGVITHTCSKALPVGAAVHGIIDWERRFDHMQQHSGEHIVSGMLCAQYHCDNVGFHMGEETVTIDYNADIPWEGVLDIERRANAYIWQDHPFAANWYEGEALDMLSYRSKKHLDGAVRITSFPGADTCACCGTHVPRSGQVGLVKFIGWQKFRDGVRLELLCGKRAMDYLASNWEQNRAVGQALSVPVQKTYAAVARLQNELLDVKARADALETASLTALAQTYQGAGDVVIVREGLEGENVRRLCDMVSEVCGGRCIVFGGKDGAYQFAVIDNANDVAPLVKSINSALNGRGGGRGGFAQGKVSATKAQIRTYFA